jgi:hypothetical protein
MPSQPPIQPLFPFNSLFDPLGVSQDDMSKDPIPIREPPSGSLNAAEPEEPPAPRDSESVETSMAPDDFKTDTIIPPEETRSDQKTEAQREGQQRNQKTGGDRARPKHAVTEYDEDGNPLWIGPSSEEEMLYIPFTASQARRFAASSTGGAIKEAGAAAAEGAADVLGPSLDASKQQLQDVADGLGSLGGGVVQQLNTMLLVLAGAYVLGQAVSGK